MAIDTLKFAKRLREAGFSDPQAEAVIATVQEAAEGAELATKADLSDMRADLKAEIAELRADLKGEIAELRAELRAGIAELRAELRAEIAALHGELREVELRFEARFEALKADILDRVFALILGAIVVNVVAIVGAMFGVAKLLGH